MREAAPVPTTLRLWITGAIIGIGIVFVFVVFQGTRSFELSDMRAMDQAQIARNLATGAGYTTKLLRPFSLAKIPQIDNHPELFQAPLHPLLMSVLFRLAGPSPRAVSWASGLPYLLMAPLVLWLGWFAFSRRVGVLAMVAVATNVGLLTTAASGTEGALLALLFTACALVLLYHARLPQRRALLAVLAGVLTGLCYLTHYLWLVAVPAVALVLLLNSARRQRGTGLVLFLLAFVVVNIPWAYRNVRVSGTPFARYAAYEALAGTRTYSGNTLARSFETTPPSVLAAMVSAPREIYLKVHDNLLMLYPLLFTIAGVVMTPFFIVAALIPLGVGGVEPGIDRLRQGVYVLAVLLLVVLALVVADGRLLAPLVPVVTVVAAAFFYQLLDLRLRAGTERLKVRWTTTAVALLLLLHALPLLLQLAPGRPLTEAAPLAIRRASLELNSRIVEMGGGGTAAQGPVYSDMPWAIAWYADRPAIWLPHSDVDQRKIEQAVGHVRWLVLTPQVAEVAEVERTGNWAAMWQAAVTGRNMIGNWRVRQRFANGAWVLFEHIPDVATTGGITPSAGGRAAPGAIVR